MLQKNKNLSHLQVPFWLPETFLLQPGFAQSPDYFLWLKKKKKLAALYLKDAIKLCT